MFNRPIVVDVRNTTTRSFGIRAIRSLPLLDFIVYSNDTRVL